MVFRKRIKIILVKIGDPKLPFDRFGKEFTVDLFRPLIPDKVRTQSRQDIIIIKLIKLLGKHPEKKRIEISAA